MRSMRLAAVLVVPIVALAVPAFAASRVGSDDASLKVLPGFDRSAVSGAPFSIAGVVSQSRIDRTADLDAVVAGTRARLGSLGKSIVGVVSDAAPPEASAPPDAVWITVALDAAARDDGVNRVRARVAAYSLAGVVRDSVAAPLAGVSLRWSDEPRPFANVSPGQISTGQVFSTKYSDGELVERAAGAGFAVVDAASVSGVDPVPIVVLRQIEKGTSLPVPEEIVRAGVGDPTAFESYLVEIQGPDGRAIAAFGAANRIAVGSAWVADPCDIAGSTGFPIADAKCRGVA